MNEDLAIVLRSAPFQERDRLVHFLTENHGRISGIAKGAIHSRRFGGSLDLFTCVRLRYVDKPGRELVRIEETVVKRDFAGLRKSIEQIAAAGYFVELVYRLTEERSPVRDVFLLLAHYLYLLEQVPISTTILRSFEIKLLDRLGYSPVMDSCVECSAAIVPLLRNAPPPIFGFSVDRGGVICPNCFPAQGMQRIRVETIAWFLTVRSTPVKELPSLSAAISVLAEGANFWRDFLRYHGPGLDRYPMQAADWLENSLREQETSAL